MAAPSRTQKKRQKTGGRLPFGMPVRFILPVSLTVILFSLTIFPLLLPLIEEKGTTVEAKLHESQGILSDFHTIGNNPVLATHNHRPVDRFMQEGNGQCFMAGLADNEPTYRIIPGISSVSHADRIV